MSKLSFPNLRIVGVASVLVATAAISGAPTVAARHGDGMIRTGSCSANSDWKLKVKAEDGGRLEVDWEVDSNVNGQTWHIVLKDDGNEVARTTRITVAPSGSFDYTKLITNRAGTDHIVAFARNRATDETCRGVIDF